MREVDIKTAGQHNVEINFFGDHQVNILVPDAHVNIFGNFKLNRGNERINLLIKHLAPRTSANTVLKGAVSDGQLDISGKIFIDQNCGQVKSFLTEKILLLSPTAKATAIPDLEILSHDVSCSHAATISPVDEIQIFYLMSRGVPRATAVEMIVDGFLR